MQALATIEDTTRAGLAQSIRQARGSLQSQAPEYVRIHLAACKQALAQRDPDVARKGAAWAMENLSATSADGMVERIVDMPTQALDAPRIHIGIALGGLPTPALAKPIDI